MVATLLQPIPVGRAMIFVPTVKVGKRVQHGLKTVGLDIPFYHSKLGTPTERDMLLG